MKKLYCLVSPGQSKNFKATKHTSSIMYTQQKKFLDISKSSSFSEMFHIMAIKSTSEEAGGYLLHFDTKLVTFG